MNKNNISIFGMKRYKIKEDQIKIKTDTLTKICDIITTKNKGYHLKLSINDNVILFGDIDHVKDNDTFNNIIDALSDFFKIEKDDIAFTLSKKTENKELSYHWSFCSYFTSMKELKGYMKIFIKQHPQFKEYIDTSVYKNGWFRLPLQTNKDKLYEHKIIKGVMQEFIVNNIPSDADVLPLNEMPLLKLNVVEDKPIKKEFNSNKDDKVIKLLSCLNDDRFNYESWFNIGCIIYNGGFQS